MSLLVNARAASTKAFHNISLANNLLNSAIHGPSGGARSNAPGDDSGTNGAAEPFLQGVSGSGKKLAVRVHPESIADTDQFLVSASGLARMGGLVSSNQNSLPIDPELVRNSATSALRGMAGDPSMALGAQANQRSDAVMKLLE